MKYINRYTMLLIAAALFAAGITLLNTGAGAQEEPWQILRADYGHKELRVDVMDRLMDLLARSGPSGAFEVNSQTMGGDPAPSKEKSLRIFTKNSRNETKEFDISEGKYVEARFFAIPRTNLDDRAARAGDRDRDGDDFPGLRIVRAYYGVQGRTVNVTDLIRSRVRDGAINFVVTNGALGGDPAPGSDKVLIVVYRYQRAETATAVREGNALTLP